MNVELHKAICNELNSTYIKKNRDYGDSFKKTRERWDVALLVRLSDKFERLCTLVETGTAEVDETIEDTLLDLANYCIMELVERGYEPPKAYPTKDFHVNDISEFTFKVEDTPSNGVLGKVLGIDFDVCDECGEKVATRYVRADGKKVCYKCWHKSEDDLK